VLNVLEKCLSSVKTKSRLRFKRVCKLTTSGPGINEYWKSLDIKLVLYARNGCIRCGPYTFNILPSPGRQRWRYTRVLSDLKGLLTIYKCRLEEYYSNNILYERVHKQWEWSPPQSIQKSFLDIIIYIYIYICILHIIIINMRQKYLCCLCLIEKIFTFIYKNP